MASIIALIALAATTSFVAGDVALLYVVHRHGARNALPKTSLLRENVTLGGPTLLPQGQRQLYNAGKRSPQLLITPSRVQAQTPDH